MKTFYLITLGCPKNIVSSEKLSLQFIDAGWQQTTSLQKADVIVVNTCGFIKNAVREAKCVLTKLAKIKQPYQKLYAYGCLAQRENTKHALDHIKELDKVCTSFKHILGKGSPSQKKAQRLSLGLPYAYVQIAEGCNQQCAFCTIPLIKGPYRSKPVMHILQEIEQLLTQGIKEIILIAQDTTSYQSKNKTTNSTVNLSQLLATICKSFPSNFWLRLMYTYPAKITDELIATIATYKQICHYLDIPLQHAHPTILKSMHRPANNKEIIQLIKKIRQTLPDIALRSTFIVGYPGEKEAEFDYLLNFLQIIRFDWVGAFRFSKEADTPAAHLPYHVPHTVKQKRYRNLMELQQQITFSKQQKKIGEKIKVIVQGKNKEKIWFARSYREAPEIDGIIYIKPSNQLLSNGDVVEVKITNALGYDLQAQLL